MINHHQDKFTIVTIGGKGTKSCYGQYQAEMDYFPITVRPESFYFLSEFGNYYNNWFIYKHIMPRYSQFNLI